jgi:hypothetical protein
MSDSRVTEERLRSWLDSNQVQRERLCAQLLPLLGTYSHVEPRRPKGGPDGARDLQALYNRELQVWGAAGFRNSAKDDNEDKKWARKKFNDDLQAALDENPALKGFVFFTNLDLTPGEQEELKSHAKSKGIGHVEVFIRERMRLALDSIEGWGYRLQFLELEMTREEQLAFIERYGTRLESLLERQRQELNEQRREVDNKLARIEFMHDCWKPTVEAMFSVNLDRPYTAEELGHFRILLRISSEVVASPGETTELLFASADSYQFSQDGVLRFFGATNRVWSRNPDEILVNSSMLLAPMSLILNPAELATANTASLGALANKQLLRSAFRTLGSFDRSLMRVHVSHSLFPKIASIAFVVNDYLIVKASKDKLVMPGGSLTWLHPPTWYEELSDDEKRMLGHLQIRDSSADDAAITTDLDKILDDDRGRRTQRPTFNLNFSEYTPLRIGRTVPVLPDIGAVQSSF